MSTEINRTYDFRGVEQIMSLDEFNAISQSGRCSLARYFWGPTEEVTPVVGVARHFAGRPGPTPEGQYPVEPHIPRATSRAITPKDARFIREYRHCCTLHVLGYVLGICADRIREWCRSQCLTRHYDATVLRVDIRQLRSEYEAMLPPLRPSRSEQVHGRSAFEDAAKFTGTSVSCIASWVATGKVRGNVRRKTVSLDSLWTHIETRTT